ncbi:HWE histidine kinase domain-containing protein, partial [Nostoc sp. NIES-2111]
FWFDLDYSPILDEDGTAVGVFAIVVDTTAKVLTERALAEQTARIEEANRRLSAESEFLQQLFEDAPSFMAMLVGPEHRFRLANAAYRRLVGARDLIGRTVREALPEIEGQGFFELLDRIMATGERHLGAGARVVLRRTPDAAAEERILDFIYQPIANASGAITGIFVEGQDVTARVQSEEHLRLVVGELNHRVKNSLTMVQAFTNQTFRNAANLQDAKSRLNDRIAMLSRANDLLTAGNWSGADIANVVATATLVHVGHDRSRLTVRGPSVRLGPRTAFSLSLALHELATNAAKHGAWSAERGSVEIRWEVGGAVESQTLSIVWMEAGGPPVTAPTTRGFGSRLLERGLASEMRARVHMGFEPSGLVCRIDAPLDHASSD